MTPAERGEILRQRWARLAPPRDSEFPGVSGEYLITAACYEYRHIFDTPKALSYLTNEVLKALHAAGLSCSAWVFLPNHYHALLGASDVSAVSEMLRIVHSRLAAAMNFQQGQKGAASGRYSNRLIRGDRHHWAS